MRYRLIVLCMLWFTLTPSVAQVGVNFLLPGVSIRVNLPVYPQLQRVPGYPVYYAPAVNSNYFFYDGLYWVYDEDNWYASSWYNGPWQIVNPLEVPFYLLRVPVRYYRHAPAYFHGWRASDPPRWGQHWGRAWEQRRSGWDQWNRRSSPVPAPLPAYQRQYSGSRYPQASQQALIQTRNYRYQPNDSVAQQHFRQQRAQAQTAPPPAAREPQAAKPAAPPQPAQVPRNAAPAREQTAIPPPAHRTERQPAPARREPQAVAPQPKLPPAQQPRQAPAAREQQAPKPPAQRAERQPQQSPVAREPQPAKQQSRPQPVQQPKPVPATREQPAPKPKGPPDKERGREKDNKDKG